MKRFDFRNLFFSFISVIALIVASGCVPSADDILNDPPATQQPVQAKISQGLYTGVHTANMILTQIDESGVSSKENMDPWQDVDQAYFNSDGLFCLDNSPLQTGEEVLARNATDIVIKVTKAERTQTGYTWQGVGSGKTDLFDDGTIYELTVDTTVEYTYLSDTSIQLNEKCRLVDMNGRFIAEFAITGTFSK